MSIFQTFFKWIFEPYIDVEGHFTETKMFFCFYSGDALNVLRAKDEKCKIDFFEFLVNDVFKSEL